MAYRAETAKPLNELAEILLRDDNNSLSRGERELIGAYVSSLNDCFFARTFMAVLRNIISNAICVYRRDQANPAATMLSDKLKALLSIAAACRRAEDRLPAVRSKRRGRWALRTGRSMTPC